MAMSSITTAAQEKYVANVT